MSFTVIFLLLGQVIGMDSFFAYDDFMSKLADMDIKDVMLEIHRCYYQNDDCTFVISDLPHEKQNLMLLTNFQIQVAKFQKRMSDPSFDQKGEKETKNK